ncbi:MAG: GAF domain-containing sensor histidine kinase, partial [Thiotrichaceae bacterium]
MLPTSIIQYVHRAHECVVLDEAAHNEMFTTDSYMINAHPESILCMPIVNRGRPMGVLYLENNQTKGVFTLGKIEILKILSSQMAISIENARLYKKSIFYQQQLKSLASSLSLAEERERRQIAENLHDRIGQSLIVMKMKLEALRESKSSNGFNSILDENKDLLDKTIQDVRSMTFELSPPVLYELGFEPTIEWLIEQFQKQHSIVIDFASDGESKPLDDDMRALLYKSVRELFFNIVKHADAHNVVISIKKKEESEIQIDVKDDGVGFNPHDVDRSMTSAGGFGLFHVRERLEHFGGHLWIRSKLGRGTHITLVAPLKCEEEKLLRGK